MGSTSFVILKPSLVDSCCSFCRAAFITSGGGIGDSSASAPLDDADFDALEADMVDLKKGVCVCV